MATDSCQSHPFGNRGMEVPQMHPDYSVEELKNEVWKTIPGFEGLYQISSIGRCNSLPRGWSNRDAATDSADAVSPLEARWLLKCDLPWRALHCGRGEILCKRRTRKRSRIYRTCAAGVPTKRIGQLDIGSSKHTTYRVADDACVLPRNVRDRMQLYCILKGRSRTRG